MVCWLWRTPLFGTHGSPSPEKSMSARLPTWQIESLRHGVESIQLDDGGFPQAKKLLFWGTGTGEPEPKGARAKQKLRRRRAPQEPRSSAETNGKDRGRDRTKIPCCWWAAVVGTARSNDRQLASTVPEVDAGGLAVVVTNSWLGNWDAREYPAKTHATTRRTSTSETEPRDLTPANRITEKSIAKSVPDVRFNVSLMNCSVRPEASDFRCRYQFGYVQQATRAHPRTE